MARYYSGLLTLGIASWSLLPLVTLACECSTTESDQTLRLTSTDQLDVFEGCTTITGHIVVESSYLGDFILSGVTEFPGNISTVDDSPAPGLGSVELPDLVELGTISLGSVANVRLPKLEHTADIVLVQPGSSGEVDLGSLVEANNYKRLTSPDSRLGRSVLRLPDLAGDYKLPRASGESGKRFIPTVGSCRTLGVRGAKWAGIVYQYLEETGRDLDFNAPKLHTLNGVLTVVGGVPGLSIGALEEGDLGITLNSRSSPGVNVIYLPNFDFANLGTASIVYLNDVPCNETLYNLWQVSPNPHDDKYCDKIEIRDEEPSDVISDDTADTTNDDTTTEEGHDDTSVEPPSNSDVADDIEMLPGGDESTEEGSILRMGLAWSCQRSELF
ncbi:hypothetical protein BJX65DRAFT_311318 [Aspergillus insuetus]